MNCQKQDYTEFPVISKETNSCFFINPRIFYHDFPAGRASAISWNKYFHLISSALSVTIQIDNRSAK